MYESTIATWESIVNSATYKSIAVNKAHTVSSASSKQIENMTQSKVIIDYIKRSLSSINSNTVYQLGTKLKSTKPTKTVHEHEIELRHVSIKHWFTNNKFLWLGKTPESIQHDWGISRTMKKPWRTLSQNKKFLWLEKSSRKNTELEKRIYFIIILRFLFYSKWRIRFKLATLTFKAQRTGYLPYLSNLLQQHEPVRSHYLSVPHHNVKFGSRAFRSSAPRVWNSLPINIRESQSLPTFRRQLKTFCFQSAYPLSAVHLP